MHQKPRGSRLATAGFTDDTERFTLGDRERYIVDRAHRLARAEQIAAHREMFGQTIDLEQWLRGAAPVLDRLEQFDRWGDLAHRGTSSGYPWRCAFRR